MFERFAMQLEAEQILKYFDSKSHWLWHLWGFLNFLLDESTADATSDFLGDINIR